jgi:hypothetical protein
MAVGAVVRGRIAFALQSSLFHGICDEGDDPLAGTPGANQWSVSKIFLIRRSHALRSSRDDTEFSWSARFVEG